MEAANIPVAGLFLNADKAFDTNDFRQECARREAEANIPRNRRAADWQTDDDTPFDPELYRQRVGVEHTNAWLDGFKTLLVRYETSVGNWLALARLRGHLFTKNQPKTDFLNSFINIKDTSPLFLATVSDSIATSKILSTMLCFTVSGNKFRIS